jgi:hypothetical protein
MPIVGIALARFSFFRTVASRLALSVCCILAFSGTEAKAFSNSSVADIATTYAGHQGQCIVFVANVLRRASHGAVGISAYAHGYQGTYRANGGKLVHHHRNAVRGDVIQVTPPGTGDGWKGPEYAPLHTAIILKNLGGGNFKVIDSNSQRRERVHRHVYNPYLRGGIVKIWRMGTTRRSSRGGASPRGHLDKAGSPAVGKIRVAGWAYDADAEKKPVNIHAYVGGKAGNKGAKGYKLGPAKKKRKDVARAKGIDPKHGFDKVFKTGKRGIQPVCVYAINRGRGSNKLLGCKDVAIKVTVGEEACDYEDGDRPGVFWPSDATWHLRNSLSAGPSDVIFMKGRGSRIPLVGDWDGDGQDSPGMFWPSDATWHLRNELSSGTSDYIFKRGRGDRIPVVGDWDGDGKDSTGMYWPSDGTWHLRNSLSHGPSDYAFKRGKKGRHDEVIPVVGDWDGDGRDSTGMFWPWDGTWHLRNSLSHGPSDYIFKRGRKDKIPLVGDWDGDGRDSTGTFWPWDGTWHLRNSLSSGPSDCIFKRGRSDRIPLVGDWDGEPEPDSAPEPEVPPPPVEEALPEEVAPVVLPAPRVRRARLDKRVLHLRGAAQHRRTALTFRLSRRARVRIVVARRRAKARNLRIAKVVFKGKRGGNRVRLSTRVGGKRLRRGRYVLTLVAKGGGKVSKPRRLRFIVRR